MADYTPKQERNGATGAVATGNTAQTGPIPDVGGMKIAAEAAGLGRTDATQDIFMSAAGSGPSPASTIEAAERQIGSQGNIWEWDAGLAVDEMTGES